MQKYIKKIDFKPKNNENDNENEREFSIMGAFQSTSIQNLCIRGDFVIQWYIFGM